MREINKIIIHCSATRPNWMHGHTTEAKWAEIRRWHVEDNKWSDIGYHYGIDRDGTVIMGRPIERAGAHTKGHNKDSIGICLLGGHGSVETDSFFENFTQAQDAALRSRLGALQAKYGPGLLVTGHNVFAAKACPGFKVSEYLEQIPIDRPFTEDTETQSPWATFFTSILKLLRKSK